LGAREFLLQLHAADLVIAVLGEGIAAHARGSGAAQSKNRKATVAADAAHRRSGRKLVTGVQVLAFRMSRPPKGRAARALGLTCIMPSKLRGQCGMNKMANLTELTFAAISLAVMAQEQRILINFCGIIPV
jgi:hypothetical protein